MHLKNLATGVALPLPNDLLWTDEHAWSPAVTAVSYLLTGALLVQSATKQTDRPITLVGPSGMAWVTRAAVNQLHGWAAAPLAAGSGRFELTLRDARVFTVAFRHQDAAIEAEPVLGFPAQANTDFYRITLQLMQI